ncbi:hypothetical protein [Burkholderia cepacia]|uniref:hypothetical protein n=1 Tax=Burkholderia cepacia TaxID=292 RepID=UPI000B0F4B98|nr:hypothetical protein [Burkholderia cepacia]
MPDRGVTVIDAIGESGKWKVEIGKRHSGRRMPRAVPSEHVRDQKEQHQQPDRHAEQPGDQVFAHVVGPGGRDAVGAAAGG